MIPTKNKNTSMINWEKELAEQAQLAAKQEANTGGGQFFSIKGGTLSINKEPIPGNEMAVIVLDSVLENVYYADAYDPESPAPPSCYAFGRADDEMEPHEKAEDKQSKKCTGCEHNEFGSAAQGRGKACKNRRRIACIPAGTIKNGHFEAFEDPEQFKSSPVTYLALPPTSLNGWGAYVKQVVGAVLRPPHGLFTRVRVMSDPKVQVKVGFEMLGLVPNSILPVIMKRHKETQDTIIFPYPEMGEKPAPKVRGKKKY